MVKTEFIQFEIKRITLVNTVLRYFFIIINIRISFTLKGRKQRNIITTRLIVRRIYQQNTVCVFDSRSNSLCNWLSELIEVASRHINIKKANSVHIDLKFIIIKMIILTNHSRVAAKHFASKIHISIFFYFQNAVRRFETNFLFRTQFHATHALYRQFFIRKIKPGV